MQYGRGALPRSFLPTYYVPIDDVVPGVLVDPVAHDDSAPTVWAVQVAGQRVLLFETTLPVRYYLPPDNVRMELAPS
ncbi:MAG: hypothetical protein ACM3JP_00740, partial [Betaproteobacteria bacterium]